MAFLDELRDRAMDLGRAGVAKSKQLAEITRLSLNNASEEDAIKKAYVEIGKLYYAERGMAPEAAYVSLCEKITAAKINIEENKARIAELKAESSFFAARLTQAVSMLICSFSLIACHWFRMLEFLTCSQAISRQMEKTGRRPFGCLLAW